MANCWEIPKLNGGFNTSRDPEFHQPKIIHSGKIPKDPCMEYLPTLGLF